MRPFTGPEKTLLAHRLFFPDRLPGEDQGEYFYRKFIYFVETYCFHVAGEYGGQPVRLMAWQKEIFRRLFSTVDENGRRKYRWLHIFIGRKNGKSLMVVLLILFWLSELSFSDPGTEIYGAASTREQASKIIFRIARMMVERSPELLQLLKVGRVPAHITNRLTGGFFEPVSSDGPKQLGKNASLVVVDEAATQPSSELWDTLSTSQGARAEPLFCSLSTAGPTRSCFYYSAVYEKIKEIQKNPEADPVTLCVLFEADENSDWRSPEAFMAANPACGGPGESGFRSRDEIESFRKAALEGEGVDGYRQYYLNQWSQHGRRNFLPLDKWDACEVPMIDVDLLRDSQCWAGLDLSLTTALSGLAILFSPNPKNPKWSVFTFAWLAGESIAECEKRDHLPYSKWVSDEVVFFDGKLTIDVESILQVLLKLKTAFPQLDMIGFDPYASAQIESWNGYFTLEPVPQQYSQLSPGIKSLQVKILNGDITHEPNPLMRSMIESARVVSDVNGNLRMDRAKSYSRIDCLASLLNAEVLGLRHYEKGGDEN